MRLATIESAAMMGDLLIAHDTTNMAIRYMARGVIVQGVTNMPANMRITAITKRAGRVYTNLRYSG